MSKAKSSLLDQLSLLSNPTPVDLDPEEAYSSLSSSKQTKSRRAEDEDDDEMAEDEAAGRGHYIDVAPSKLRRDADQRRREAEDLEKYGGVRASRKELFGNGGRGSASEDDDGSENEEEEGPDNVEDEEDEDAPFGQAEDDESSSSDEDMPFTPAAAPTPTAAPTESLEATQILSSLRQSRSEDVSKGLAVKKQLEFFENVLLVRMKMQKAVVGLGALKTPEVQEELRTPSDATQQAVDACTKEAQKLSEGLFEMRQALLKASEPSIEIPAPKRRKISPLADSAASSYAQDAAEDALALSDLAHPNLVSTLQKWSTKILAAQGLTNLNRGEKFKSVKLGALEQITASLEGLEGRRKVQRFCGGSDALAATDDAADKKPSAFGDDKEFYQSLVRDIIDRRSGTNGIADGPTHANLGPKVKKASLDTRASKGRKLRYTPHDKIMNFMAPFKPEGSWHDEQVDELFGSLLGQRIQLGEDDEEMEDADETAGDVGLGGLRVF